MNLSTLIKRIKMNIGIYGIALPIENVDGMIADIIQEFTIPTFSPYSPCYSKLVTRDIRNDFEIVEDSRTSITILLPESERKIIGVRQVTYLERDLLGAGYSSAMFPIMEGGFSQQMIMSNAAYSMVNQMLPGITHKFEHPRKLTIYNIAASNSLSIELMYEHDISLASISPTMEEAFFNISLLDVKENLYNMMKHYNEIETAIGRISLKIDDWQNASQERTELLEKWSDLYHLDILPCTYK